MSEPFVSCVMPAYNYERFVGRALDSALAQTYPAEAMEIVVIDDGSTDGTADVVRSYDDPRIRYVLKENGGLNSAIDRGIAEARGELIALLDADDTWPADKLRRQVDVLKARPEVGLVHGDMEVIDHNDVVIDKSFFSMWDIPVLRGRLLPMLIQHNSITQGAMVFRSSLRHAYHPIGAASAFPDWWISVQISRVAEIEVLEEPTNRYRIHGENMAFGVEGEKLARSMLNGDIPYRRWLLCDIRPGELSPEELIQGRAQFIRKVKGVTDALDMSVKEVTPPDCEQAAEATAAGFAALGDRDLAEAARLLVKASAHDPSDEAPADGLELVRDALGEGWGVPPEGARSWVTLAYADELADHPEMLVAYSQEFSAEDDATLMILSRFWSAGEAVERLGPALAAAGLDGDGGPDLMLHEGHYARPMAQWLGAMYSRRENPAFDEHRLDELKDLARTFWARERAGVAAAR